jgi:hypothetical protein
MAANTGHSAPDNSWIESLNEEVLEPELPIVDPHHHLWVRNGYTYLLPELALDLASGHNIVGTVYAECHSMYRPKRTCRAAGAGRNRVCSRTGGNECQR